MLMLPSYRGGSGAGAPLTTSPSLSPLAAPPTDATLLVPLEGRAIKVIQLLITLYSFVSEVIDY